MFSVHPVQVDMIMRSLRRFSGSNDSVFSLLATNHIVPAVETAASSWGLYGVGNEAADNNWKSFTTSLLEKIDAKATPIDSVNRILSVLSSNNVSIGSFWSQLFADKVDAKVTEEKLRLGDMITLVQACNGVDFRSDTVMNKFIAMMLENETVWIVSPDELVQVARTVADSYTQNRQLFSEIANRVILENADFSNQQLIAILEAFGRINFINEQMFNTVMRQFLGGSQSSFEERARIGEAISRLRFRSDTFFKKLVTDLIESEVKTPEILASVCVSMQRMKMNTGRSEWWDRESDFDRLVDTLRGSYNADGISMLNAKQISHCVQVIRNHGDKTVCDAVMERLKYLLVQDPLSRSHRYLSVILEALSRGQTSRGVHVDHLRWVAEWLCGNVYILPVHDIATINRAIAKLGFKDHNYHKIWIPYYIERLSELTKDDIALIQDNFNHIGMSDSQMGGRHFFYKLGKRFQELVIEENGDKELTTRRKYRNLQRLG